MPQWNCNCQNCLSIRAGSLDVRPRTQSSVAVSVDGRSWFLLNASADVRTQIGAAKFLWPAPDIPRGTSIAGCVLTDAEIDHTSGLLQLREGCRFGVFSTAIVKRWLHQALPIGTILAEFADRPWTELILDEWSDLPLPDGKPSGLVHGHSKLVGTYLGSSGRPRTGSWLGGRSADQRLRWRQTRLCSRCRYDL